MKVETKRCHSSANTQAPGESSRGADDELLPPLTNMNNGTLRSCHDVQIFVSAWNIMKSWLMVRSFITNQEA